ncbi:DinB family protein [Catellatospora tritici]|uniref:DinB family protein n=1 Tax=Catellatospora tritici TaxID=2851566 RepID=UPI001C2D037C|nr:DinB family protein [Catellatospora tritici]MBV1850835.1 DinB family protein [Catellatospora tritici]MBV1851088.1 DinB family protein [Catellatospora tritici]
MTSADASPVERIRPPENGTERDTLVGLLDFLRATVVHKVYGLSDEQAFARPVAASQLTPGGLLKHLTAVERYWFSIDFAALDVAWPSTEQDGFPIEPGDTLAGIVAGYVAECERSRSAIAGAELDAAARGEGMAFTLRYALAHMIEETARHCGHLDLLRESIDGQTGQ